MRVTLYKCSICGTVYSDENPACFHGGKGWGRVEPIVFAPLPSDATREAIRSALIFTVGNASSMVDEQCSDALTEIEECWKEGT